MRLPVPPPRHVVCALYATRDIISRIRGYAIPFPNFLLHKQQIARSAETDTGLLLGAAVPYSQNRGALLRLVAVALAGSAAHACEAEEADKSEPAPVRAVAVVGGCGGGALCPVAARCIIVGQRGDGAVVAGTDFVLHDGFGLMHGISGLVHQSISPIIHRPVVHIAHVHIAHPAVSGRAVHARSAGAHNARSRSHHTAGCCGDVTCSEQTHGQDRTAGKTCDQLVQNVVPPSWMWLIADNFPIRHSIYAEKLFLHNVHGLAGRIIRDFGSKRFGNRTYRRIGYRIVHDAGRQLLTIERNIYRDILVHLWLTSGYAA